MVRGLSRHKQMSITLRKAGPLDNFGQRPHISTPKPQGQTYKKPVCFCHSSGSDPGGSLTIPLIPNACTGGPTRDVYKRGNPSPHAAVLFLYLLIYKHYSALQQRPQGSAPEVRSPEEAREKTVRLLEDHAAPGALSSRGGPPRIGPV